MTHLFDGKPKTAEDQVLLAEIMKAGRIAMETWLNPRPHRFPTAAERDLICKIFRVDQKEMGGPVNN